MAPNLTRFTLQDVCEPGALRVTWSGAGAVSRAEEKVPYSSPKMTDFAAMSLLGLPTQCEQCSHAPVCLTCHKNATQAQLSVLCCPLLCICSNTSYQCPGSTLDVCSFNFVSSSPGLCSAIPAMATNNLATRLAGGF